jgi:hypothetical protein
MKEYQSVLRSQIMQIWAHYGDSANPSAGHAERQIRTPIGVVKRRLLCR